MGRKKERRKHEAYVATTGALEAIARSWNVRDRPAIVQAVVDWRKSERRKAPIMAGPLPADRVRVILNGVKPPPPPDREPVTP